MSARSLARWRLILARQSRALFPEGRVDLIAEVLLQGLARVLQQTAWLVRWRAASADEPDGG